QTEFCGAAGVMNDLGMHALHAPFALGWRPRTVHADLQNIVEERPGPDGALVPCDTIDNATLHIAVTESDGDGGRFPLTVETKRIAPGHKNTWFFEAIGMDGGVRFSTKNPKRVEVFAHSEGPVFGGEQAWQSVDSGSQSSWP